MPVAPEGTVSFLFTDIVGSTKLWEKFPATMGAALARHDEILRTTCESHDGYVFKTVGDAFCVAFPTMSDALLAAIESQRKLRDENWGDIGNIKVRMGIHAGTAEFRDRDYFGGVLNRVSRIESAAHGGQILTSQVSVDLVQDEPLGGIAFKALGEHRLRNLERPEFLHQVLADGLETDFPPPKSLEVMPNNLPVQTTSFIGREKEIDEVKRLLKTTRLLTLMGMGGTGKTRLALEVGSQIIGKYQDGVWLVELALVTDPDRIFETIANVVGVREEAERPIKESVRNFFKGKTLLLVIDNCEHVLSAIAAGIADLLKNSPHVKVLATSRHSLGIAGETIFPVPPLSMFDIRLEDFSGPNLAERLNQFEAVKLFVARAVAVQPSFVVTNANAPAVAEICSRLDGIPLAIELAAARVRSLSVEQIASRLGDRFRLLRGGTRDGLPHQQTLQALIDWSHDLLSEKERLLFRRLSVFAGGRTLEAVEVVCACNDVEEWEIVDLLDQLVSKSLVTIEQDTFGDPRYTMIESVWQYAREKLETSGEVQHIRDKHLDYFLKMAEEAAPHFEGIDQKEWLERFWTDRVNFRTAFEWAVASNRTKEGLRLVTALHRAIEVRGNPASIRDIYQIFLRIAGESNEDFIERAWALDAAGRLSWAQDLYKDARHYYTEAADMFDRLGATAPGMYTRTLIAFLDRGDGDRESARKRFQYGLDWGREHNDIKLIGVASSGLGSIALDDGNFDEARKLKEESLVMCRKMGDRWVIGLILWGIAHVAIAQGDMPRAHSAITEWADIVQDLGNRWMLAYVFEAAGEAALAEDKAERAAKLFGAAEEIREHFGAQFSNSEAAQHDEMMKKLATLLPKDVIADLWKLGRQASPTSILRTA